MAPIMPVSVPSAGGSKNAIAPCVATRYPRMRCVLVACLPGVATSSIRRTELTWQGSCSKEELPGILIACSWLTSGYQLSNDHGGRNVTTIILLEWNLQRHCLKSVDMR